MKKLSDEELLVLIRLDNERAFSALFDRHKGTLYRHIYQRTNLDTESEEILQTIFISFWKNRQTIVIQDSILPYLMGAAKKSILGLYARTTKEIKHNHLLLARSEPFEYPAEEFLIARELETLMDVEIQKMPVTMRDTFTLSRKEQLSTREIAVMLNISEQTVKNNITMAIKYLRMKLTSKNIIQLLPFFIFFN